MLARVDEIGSFCAFVFITVVFHSFTLESVAVNVIFHRLLGGISPNLAFTCTWDKDKLIRF